MENNKIAISVKNVTLAYESLSNYSLRKNLFGLKKRKKKKYVALKNISFDVEKGSIIGVIGRNGCGKSTLLKTIGGVLSPDSGSIDIYDNSISLMAIGIGFNNNLSGYENIYLSGMLLGFSEEEIKSKEKEIIEFSELDDFIYEPVKTYSSGMSSKLAFSITAILETDIMLIDEVLSVGDINFREKSYNKMKSLIENKDKTIIIVSHQMDTIRELCDKVIWLHDGELVLEGEPNKTIKEYVKYMKSIIKK